MTLMAITVITAIIVFSVSAVTLVALMRRAPLVDEGGYLDRRDQRLMAEEDSAPSPPPPPAASERPVAYYPGQPAARGVFTVRIPR